MTIRRYRDLFGDEEDELDDSDIREIVEERRRRREMAAPLDNPETGDVLGRLILGFGGGFAGALQGKDGGDIVARALEQERKARMGTKLKALDDTQDLKSLVDLQKIRAQLRRATQGANVKLTEGEANRDVRRDEIDVRQTEGQANRDSKREWINTQVGSREDIAGKGRASAEKRGRNQGAIVSGPKGLIPQWGPDGEFQGWIKDPSLIPPAKPRAGGKGPADTTDRYVLKLSERIGASGAPEMIELLDRIDRLIPGGIEGAGNIPGTGGTAWAPSFLLSDEGKQLRLSTSELQNIILQKRSGAAISEPEAKRLANELAIGMTKSDAELREALQNVKRKLAAGLANMEAGTPRGALQTYQSRQGAVGSHHPALRAGRPSSPKTPGPKPSPSAIQRELRRRGLVK